MVSTLKYLINKHVRFKTCSFVDLVHPSYSFIKNFSSMVNILEGDRLGLFFDVKSIRLLLRTKLPLTLSQEYAFVERVEITQNFF